MNTDTSGILGRSTTRVDGPDKVTGRARYAADHAITPTPYTGWIVEAPMCGRITKLDVTAAEAAPGVVRVLTYQNAPEQLAYGQPDDAGRFAMSHAILAGDHIRHPGEAVALVVADTLEAARGAALLVKVEIEKPATRFDVTGAEKASVLDKPDSLDGGQDADVTVGDFEAEMGRAAVVIDETFTTSRQASAAMEPHATIAEYDGTKLTVHSSVQIVASAVQALAHTLKLDPGNVRVLAPFVGGGFGSKLGLHGDAFLASLAAKALGHPVKVVQTRRNVFTNAPHRGNSHQRVRLGATAEGKLLAVGHDSVMPMAKGYEFAAPVAAGARASYACKALRTTHRIVPVNMPPIDSMRAPGEAIGSLALESAMDQLACALGKDPLQLRLDNLAEREPQSDKPFASYDLGHCLERGAEAFGWADRPAPRQRRGRWWTGWGMASCTRMNLLMQASARVVLGRGGKARAELDMTDIGTGSYTILSQIVADELGLELSDVTAKLGDSALPKTAGSGGSFGAASSGGALLEACHSLRTSLVARATSHPDSPLRGKSDGPVQLADGRLHIGNDSMELTRLLALGGELSAEGQVAPGADQKKFAQYSYGAHFVELGVDDASGEIRLRRLVGAFSFGRVLNPLTARSQLMGGMVFGIGQALTEHLELDPRHGMFPNRDFAGYHLPVQRDVPDLDILMLGEPDEKCGPLGSKGIGELALCGLAGAISSAVHHATGVRLRDFPLTPDRVLAALDMPRG